MPNYCSFAKKKAYMSNIIFRNKHVTKKETNVERWELHIQKVGMVWKLGGGGRRAAMVAAWHG
jgi:hypothetical protein